MAALAKVVAASRAEPPPPPSPKGGTLADLSATEKRRVAKLVQQLLAVEKAHQGAQARWRATQADLERRAAAAEAELAKAREALERAEPIRRDLEEARRSRQAETARADAADARNAVLARTTTSCAPRPQLPGEAPPGALAPRGVPGGDDGHELPEENRPAVARRRAVEAADASGVAV